MNNKIKPSEYQWPWNSVFHKMEYEKVAHNIMIIMSRNGDAFYEVPITWKEYVAERLKDEKKNKTGCSAYEIEWQEKSYFEAVIEYCKNPEMAAKFSEDWQ